MPVPHPKIPPAATPKHSKNFDPWNSSSSGHQRPDMQPGTGWRNSRNAKLTSQFRAGAAGGERLADTWGAGAEGWDEKIGAVVPKELRQRKEGQRSVVDLLMKPGKMKEDLESVGQGEVKHDYDSVMERRRREDEEKTAQEGLGVARKIFDGVVVYVNGSTFPLVSDHKLKHILAENGGNVSLHLGRRKVTHVILGKPNGGNKGAGAGGGLAGGKLDREIKKIGGASVKYVDVSWVLESLKAGKRLPEARFSNLKIAAKGQGSVYSRAVHLNQPPVTKASTGDVGKKS